MNFSPAVFAIVRAVSAAAGLVALVTPFTADISPIEGLVLAFGLEGDALAVFVVSAPALLAVPVALWQVRRILSVVPKRLEIALAYLLSTAAMLPVLVVSYLAFSGGEQARGLLNVTALAVYWCAAIGNVGLYVRNRLKEELPERRAEVFLLLGYVPNALYALIIFSYWEIVFGPSWMWDAGAYVVLATCILYGSQALRRPRRRQAGPNSASTRRTRRQSPSTPSAPAVRK